MASWRKTVKGAVLPAATSRLTIGGHDDNEHPGHALHGLRPIRTCPRACARGGLRAKEPPQEIPTPGRPEPGTRHVKAPGTRPAAERRKSSPALRPGCDVHIMSLYDTSVSDSRISDRPPTKLGILPGRQTARQFAQVPYRTGLGDKQTRPPGIAERQRRNRALERNQEARTTCREDSSLHTHCTTVQLSA